MLGQPTPVESCSNLYREIKNNKICFKEEHNYVTDIIYSWMCSLRRWRTIKSNLKKKYLYFTLTEYGQHFKIRKGENCRGEL